MNFLERFLTGFLTDKAIKTIISDWIGIVGKINHITTSSCENINLLLD
jgi:hypothetical protein